MIPAISSQPHVPVGFTGTVLPCFSQRREMRSIVWRRRVQPKGGHPLWAFAVVQIVIFAAAGCFQTQPVSPGSKDGPTGSLGSIALASRDFGSVTVQPTSCVSGGPQHFLGADFGDDKSGFTVRLVVDPLEGPAVRAFSSETPFDKSVVFRRSECRTFHFSLDSTGWRINDVDDYRVTLDLDCASKTGDSIQGKLGATHCH